jgi:transposase
MGLIEPEKWRLTVAARREKAKALVDGGMSQRAAAAALEVDKRTIGRDLRHCAPESGAMCPIDEWMDGDRDVTERLARREAAILANEALAAVSAQVRHLIGEGLVDADQLRLTIEARRQKAKELVVGGMSTRDVAAALGTSQSTVMRDVNQNGSQSEPQQISDRDERRETTMLANEAPAPVGAPVRHLVDEGGVGDGTVRKLHKRGLVGACQDLLAEIKEDPAAVAAAMRRGPGS